MPSTAIRPPARRPPLRSASAGGSLRSMAVVWIAWVLLMGLASGGAGLIIFGFAESTAWLFAGRALQGLAVGMASSAATAALVELEPNRDARRPALLAGLAQAGGS